MTLIELHQRRKQLVTELQTLENEYVNATNQRKREQEDVAYKIAAVEAGRSLKTIEIAERVMDIEGSYLDAGEDRDRAVQMAKDFFAGMPSVNLYQDYVGTKNYDRWRGQYVTGPTNTCPRHGNVCFSISLDREYRGLNPVRGLTDAERTACLTYLEGIYFHHTAKKQAAEGKL